MSTLSGVNAPADRRPRDNHVAIASRRIRFGVVVCGALGLLGCLQPTRPARHLDAGADGPIADAAETDIGADDSAPDVTTDLAADLARDRAVDLDPLSGLGECDPQSGYLSIHTADGASTIAAVQATGCTRSELGCWPGEKGADGGSACAAILLMTTTSTASPECRATLTSITGRQIEVSAQLKETFSGLYCRSYDRKIELPTLTYEPPEIVVHFESVDAGP
jgi:hypothetical protein